MTLINFLGCIWNFVAEAEGYENTWINYYKPFVREYAANGLYLTPEEIRSELNPVWQYFTGVYWALATVGDLGRMPATLPPTLPPGCLCVQRWHGLPSGTFMRRCLRLDMVTSCQQISLSSW